MNNRLRLLGGILLILAMLIPSALTFAQSEEQGNPNWVDINKLNNKIFDDVHFQFNPMGVKEIRHALDVLINREFLIDNILMGGGLPELTAIRPSHPAYPILNIDEIAEKHDLYPAGDIQKAVEIYNNALAKLNATYHEYGFSLVFKKGSDGKTWLYLVTPDGTEKLVKIYFVIRIEDERKQIGEQIANWIEQYFHIKVVRIERERGVVTPIIYGTNPASFGFKTNPWTLYTEGWISMGDDPTYYARYDAAFFDAPLRGYGPNHRISQWWYYYNPEAYKLGLDLYFKTYTPEMVNQLWNDTRHMIDIGRTDAIRIWIANTLEYFMVNNKHVRIPYYGNQSGLWSNWGLRTATSTTGSIVALEFSSTGGLFMSPWNTVLGLNDVYGRLIWDQVASTGMYSHYHTGIPTETTLTYSYHHNYTVTSEGDIVGHIKVPDDAIVFDPVEKKWIPIKQAAEENKTYIPGVSGYKEYNGEMPVELIFNYDKLHWHDGANMTLADILGTLAFEYEWAVDTSKYTNQTDLYYDSEYAENAYPTLDLIKGIKIINDTALAVYTDYVDVDPALVAYTIYPYATIPYDLLAAMEWAVVNDPGGTNYGWTTRETTGEVGIDMLIHGDVIKEAAQKVAQTGVYYFNGLSDLGYNFGSHLADRVNLLVNWINEHGHAAVSNGPFYVDSYNPQANQLVLKSITNLGFPKIHYHGVNISVPNVNEIVFKSVTTIDAGIAAVKEGSADVFLYSRPISQIGEVPSTVTLIPTSSGYIDLATNLVSNVYDSNKPGEIQLRGETIKGALIPGLVLYNPEEVLKPATATTTSPTTTTPTTTTTSAPATTTTSPTTTTTTPATTTTTTTTQTTTATTPATTTTTTTTSVPATTTTTTTTTSAPATTTTSPTTTTTTTATTTHGVSGALVGGIVVIIIVIAVAAFFAVRRK